VISRGLLLGFALALFVAAPATAATLVHYERSGGFAGQVTKVRVTKAGRVFVAPQGSQYVLSQRGLRSLKRLIREAELDELPRHNRPPTPIADGYHYLVRSGGRTVEADQGGVPKRLRPLIRRLDKLAARGS
jgi:hypothetical protein